MSKENKLTEVEWLYKQWRIAQDNADRLKAALEAARVRGHSGYQAA